jgi:hypothetical protein
MKGHNLIRLRHGGIGGLGQYKMKDASLQAVDNQGIGRVGVVVASIYTYPEIST